MTRIFTLGLNIHVIGLDTTGRRHPLRCLILLKIESELKLSLKRHCERRIKLYSTQKWHQIWFIIFIFHFKNVFHIFLPARKRQKIIWGRPKWDKKISLGRPKWDKNVSCGPAQMRRVSVDASHLGRPTRDASVFGWHKAF